jgi:hypothetical protein
MIYVKSANGNIHLAEIRTKRNEFSGLVRKLCTGQWISDKHQVKGLTLTCKHCIKMDEKKSNIAQ